MIARRIIVPIAAIAVSVSAMLRARRIGIEADPFWGAHGDVPHIDLPGPNEAFAGVVSGNDGCAPRRVNDAGQTGSNSRIAASNPTDAGNPTQGA